MDDGGDISDEEGSRRLVRFVALLDKLDELVKSPDGQSVTIDRDKAQMLLRALRTPDDQPPDLHLVGD